MHGRLHWSVPCCRSHIVALHHSVEGFDAAARPRVLYVWRACGKSRRCSSRFTASTAQNLRRLISSCFCRWALNTILYGIGWLRGTYFLFPAAAFDRRGAASLTRADAFSPAPVLSTLNPQPTYAPYVSITGPSRDILPYGVRYRP